MPAIYSGIIVDNTEDGLYVDANEGLAVDSILNLSVDTANFSISPSIPYTIKYLNLSQGNFTSVEEETLFAVNPDSDLLDLGGNTYLPVDQYVTYDTSIHRTKTFVPAVLSITPEHIGTFINQAVYVLPESFNITSSIINIEKINKLYAEQGNYSITSFAIYTQILNKLPEGKYIKDSANIFTLYVNEGIDYFIVVDAEKIGVSDFNNMQISGLFAKHPTSLNKYIITTEILNSEQLKLKIPSEITSGLRGRFKFDVVADIQSSNRVLLQGDIIINELVA